MYIHLLRLSALTILLSSCQIGIGATSSGTLPQTLVSPSFGQSLPGGFVTRDPNTTELQAIAKEAERLLNAMPGDTQYTFDKVLEASSKTEAGEITDIKVAYTDNLGRQSFVTLRVYRDLQNRYSLSAPPVFDPPNAGNSSPAPSTQP